MYKLLPAYIREKITISDPDLEPYCRILKL
jgi:hypothetical protein